jgi:hypothetical protein
MKKALLAVAVLGFASAAFAGDNHPQLNGGVSVSSTSNTVAGSYINGNGSSNEWANTVSNGSATLTVSHSVNDTDSDDVSGKSVTISTNTNSFTNTTAGGSTDGAGISVNAAGQSTIYNGAIGFGSTTATAGGSFKFGDGAVQPVGAEQPVSLQ